MKTIQLKDLKIQASEWRKDTNVYVFYQVKSERQHDCSDSDIEDLQKFATMEEAEEYYNDLTPSIGFTPVIDKCTIEVESDDNLETELNDINKTLIDIETIIYGDESRGRDITGSIIIEWNYEKYVGYARNLTDIGIAGQSPFEKFNYENDLISDNEDRTFRSNYSLLILDEDLKDLASDEAEELIYEELNKSFWKWNHFKNNPNSAVIVDKIENLF